MGLLELASQWLQKSDLNKSIQVRTKDVVFRFKNYCSASLPEQSFEDFGITKQNALGLIQDINDKIVEIINSYLDGNLIQAISLAGDLLGHISPTHSEDSLYYYRARDNKSGFLYGREEMFHIPYECRHKISNQRYSVSGLPCLYLGSSTYICWEELERPDYQTCNFCVAKSTSPVWYFDLCIPQEIHSIEDLYRVCIALACSLKSQRDHIFKLEYIIPQCILYSIINNPHYAHDGIGIRYYSVHFLHQESSTFYLDFDSEDVTSRYINIVIPAQKPKQKGLSDLLKRMFHLGHPMSLMYRYLVNSDAPALTSEIADDYCQSQFGLLESYLKNAIDLEEHSENYQPWR